MHTHDTSRESTQPYGRHKAEFMRRVLVYRKAQPCQVVAIIVLDSFKLYNPNLYMTVI